MSNENIDDLVPNNQNYQHRNSQNLPNSINNLVIENLEDNQMAHTSPDLGINVQNELINPQNLMKNVEILDSENVSNLIM